MKHSAPYGWLVNHLTYKQTYSLISILFALSLFPLMYSWVNEQMTKIGDIDQQIQSIQQEENVKQIIEHLQKERALSQRYLLGSKDLKAEIEILKTQTGDLIEQAIDNQKDFSLENTPTAYFNPQLLQSRWSSIQKRGNNLSIEELDQLYSYLINHILIQVGYVNSQIHAKSNPLLIKILYQIPSLQELMQKLFLLTERGIQEEAITPLLRIQIEERISRIQIHLSYLNIPVEQTQAINPELNRLLTNYAESTNNLISLIQSQILDSTKIDIAPLQFLSLIETNTNLCSQLWFQALHDFRNFLMNQRQLEQKSLWIPLLTSLGLALVTFLLGLGVNRNFINRINANTEATERFTNGDFSVRVPSIYNDEIGKQSNSFNHMAEKMQTLINQLNELVEAITELSNGNLSARIKVRANQTEFNQVAIAFNKMAETFERIITRLHQVGITLTTSATEIAAASREQETITVEQEASTREIAVAANEISSTAKEFASTMHEVGLAAEQTSNLALKGKESLTNMEVIMRHMVDASTTIASKLGVLNERAGNITSVITTITKVAGQTNLLSLNASIEAEKAGEYGRSFAVIAREIRRLADQTAIATLDIEKIVNEIMTAVSSSVMGVDDFTQEIRRGVDQVRTVSGQLAIIIEHVQEFIARFELVNQGMQTQSTGAEQINEAIAQLSQSAQQTTESIHHFHNTIEELNRAANELHNLISFISPKSIKEKPEEEPMEIDLPRRTTRADAARQFKRTLSNLSDTSQRLRNLHSLLKNPVQKENESQE